MSEGRLRRISLDVFVILLALGIVGYYLAHIYREELRDWQRVRVDFKQVGGLEVGDDVLVEGARMGRVASIQFTEDKQQVTLEVEPELELFSHGIRAEIVPVSALGTVAVDLDVGERGTRAYDPEVPVQGEVRVGLGAGASTGPGRTKELTAQVQDFERYTRELMSPDTGMLGYLLFDPDGMVRAKDRIDDVHRLWTQLDEGLAELENGDTVDGPLATESLVAVGDAVRALHEGLDAMRDTLRPAARGEGMAGRVLSDPTFGADWREALLRQEEAWAETVRGDTRLGRLVVGENLAEGVDAAFDRARAMTGAAVQGEGLLGALSDPDAGRSLERTLENLEGGLHDLRSQALIRGDAARIQVWDRTGDLEDGLRNMRRGIGALRGALPDKTFQGALFAIF